MNKIKILVCYHKRGVLLQNSILTPIHCGRALSGATPDDEWMRLHMCGDDTGENISHKNPSYNELTAIYWAYKNYDKLGNPDYIGLMHYRRHFIFTQYPALRYMIPEVDSMGNPGSYLRHLHCNPFRILAYMWRYDFLCFMGKVGSVYDNYKEHHPIEELDLAISILKRLHPDYAASCDEYMAGDTGFYYNMFVLPRKLFFAYCDWLFPILEEFERQVDLTGKRLFISERIGGVFLFDLVKKGNRCRDLPISFVKK